MALPAGYRPRKGDVLVVLATVKYDIGEHDTDVHLTVGDYQHTMLPLAEIVGTHAMNFKVGDRVAPREQLAFSGEILALDDGCAWIKYDRGGYATDDVAHLVPVGPMESRVEKVVDTPDGYSIEWSIPHPVPTTEE